MLAIFFIFIDSKVASVNQFRQKLSIVVYPIQWVIDAPPRIIGSGFNYFKDKEELIADINSLKQENFLLQAKLIKLESLEKDLILLKKLTKSKNFEGKQGTVSRILRVDADPFSRILIIDKGQSEGTFIGQPVIDSKGLIGNIIATSVNTSSLLLVSDPANAVPVINLRNGLRGIAIGTGSSYTLELQHLPLTSDIQVGDKFVTSGLGGRYPKGYPVGEVKEINNNPSKKFLNVSLTPNAEIDSANIVLLLNIKDAE